MKQAILQKRYGLLHFNDVGFCLAGIRHNDADLTRTDLGAGDFVHCYRPDLCTCFSIQKAHQFPPLTVLTPPFSYHEQHRQEVATSGCEHILITRWMVGITPLFKQSFLS